MQVDRRARFAILQPTPLVQNAVFYPLWNLLTESARASVYADQES